jgi:hypothetical protein
MRLRACCAIPLFLLLGGLVRGGEIHYDPPERTLALSDLVLIATQTGQIDYVQKKAPDGQTVGLFVSDFEVRRVLKGAFAEKRIRVLSNYRWGGGIFYKNITVDLGETVVMFLKHAATPEAGRPNWQVLGVGGSLYAVNPQKMDGAAKEIEDRLRRLQELKEKALAEMTKLDPEALDAAQKLLPGLRKAQSEAQRAPDGILRSLRGADLRALRAVGILAYLDEQPATELRELVSKKAAALPNAEKDAVKAWLRSHWPHVNEPEGINAFANANAALVVRFYGRFPPDAVWMPDLQLKPDPEAARALQFLIYAEDPGYYDLYMKSYAAHWTRRGVKKGEKPEPVFGKMRVPWIKDLVLAWAAPGADERLLEPALIVMNENPGPWTEAWIDAERARKYPKRLHLVAGPAVGLGDANLVAELWKDAARNGGDEEKLCLALDFFRFFHPTTALLACEGWKTAIANARQRGDSGRSAGWVFKGYLSNCRTFLEGTEEEFTSYERAAYWARETFLKKTPTDKKEK